MPSRAYELGQVCYLAHVHVCVCLSAYSELTMGCDCAFSAADGGRQPCTPGLQEDLGGEPPPEEGRAFIGTGIPRQPVPFKAPRDREVFFVKIG